MLDKRARSSPTVIDRSEKIALAAVASVWLSVLLAGGSARPDVIQVAGVRLAALGALGVLLLAVPRHHLKSQSRLLLFAALVGATVAVQLIPLPPPIWQSLPGRELYAELDTLTGLAGTWRPLSLSPDLTWNALLALIPPLFFLLAVPTLRQSKRWLLAGLLGSILVSGVLGLLQLAGGPDSALRFYRFNNSDSAIGFFANRNHEAVFLAMGIPLAAWWANLGREGGGGKARLAIAFAMVFFLLTAGVTTQSRMGALIVGVSLVLSAILLQRDRGRIAWRWFAAALALFSMVAVVAFASWPRMRLSVTALTEDKRIRILEESLSAIETFFPVGAGVGAFPNVFRRFESMDDLAPTYFNHTHSEITQIPIEGGTLLVAIVCLFLAWFAKSVWKVWSIRDRSAAASEARLCTILIVLPLIGSITDYPLRTPLLACSFAISASILHLQVKRLHEARPL